MVQKKSSFYLPYLYNYFLQHDDIFSSSIFYTFKDRQVGVRELYTSSSLRVRMYLYVPRVEIASVQFECKGWGVWESF